MDLEKTKQRIAEGEISAIEDAWMAAMEQGAPLPEMREALSALVAAGHTETAETLGWVFLSECLEERTAEEALDVARAILPALPGNQELRDTAAGLYRSVHGRAEHFEDLLEASGLEGDQSLRRAIQTLETSLAIAPGVYLANRFDSGIVRAERFDSGLGEFELVSPDGRRTQLEPKLLADEYAVVEETDFRVLEGFRREALGQCLQRDPATVLMGVCMSHGDQIDAGALKELLVPRYVEPGKWSGWWNRARSAAKRSDRLSLEGRNPTVVRYHPHGRSLEEELAAAVEEARTPLAYLAVLRQYAREAAHRRVEVDPAFVGPIVQKLGQQAESFQARRPGDALAASLAVEAAAGLGLPKPQGACPAAADVLGGTDRPAEAVAQLTDMSLWPGALDALGRREDAPVHFERLLRVAPSSQLDDIAARLRAAGRAEAVARVVADTLTNPAEHLQVCLWLWQGPAQSVEGAESRLELLSRLLSVMQEISREWDFDRDARRIAFHQIRAALVAEDCKMFRGALTEMDEGVAATVKRRIERSPGLSPTSRGDLLGILREEFHALFLQERPAPWLDEAVGWTTQEALSRREADLKELMEVKIPANSRAIGAAAAMGDLSENSEWQFAVEERRRLQGRAAQIQDDLVRARVLRPDDVPTDTVGIGSRVVLKALADGQEIELTILGPWESDVDNRVYSYRSALCQSILGKSVGQTATLKLTGADQEYRIERIESAL